MKATEKIKEIKKCATIEEVNELLKDETRKTVLDAGEERIGEITRASEKSEEAPKEEAPKETVSDKSDPKKGKKEKQPSTEDIRVALFERKVGYPTCANVEQFANDFFGDQIKSIKTKDFIVTITLKSGRKIQRRGK
jgi:hypothetical protein